MKHIIVLVFASVLGACSMVPEPVQYTQDIPLVTFEQVMNNPVGELPKGEKARWGGKIVSVQNKESHSEIEVVYFPESSSGKPRLSETSLGRFKVLVDGFVDPLVYQKERLITVLGEVGSPEAGIIGEQAYVYPTLNAEGYYMWKDTTEVEIDHIGMTPLFWGRGRSAFWDPWYSPWRSHIHSRVRYSQTRGYPQGKKVNTKPRDNRVKATNHQSSNGRNHSSNRTSSPQPKTQLR